MELKMEDTNPNRLKDSKRMDANTVWQWRIMHVKKYSRSPEPFHYSNKIGLDFNVGSTEQKLDLQLLTNGVMLEICDFAKMVTKGKSHFIMNILENNFDLGLENEQQRIHFRAQISHKLKDLMRRPPKEKLDIAALFGSSFVPVCARSIKKEPNVGADCQYFGFQLKKEDNGRHTSKIPCSQTSEKKIDRLHADVSDDEEEIECLGAQLKEEIRGDVLPFSYPYCEEIGLRFESGAKQSLDPGLLTNGMMVELVDFTRVLIASYSSIILSVLKHNFELDLQNQQDKKQVLFSVSQLLKRRKKLKSTGTKISPHFKNELFSFETNPFKRAPTQLTMEELLYESLKKRRKYNSKANMQNECDMEEETMETESNMWKLRANRVKQILLVLDKEYCTFFRPNKANLEFNIGFGPKKNLSGDYLTNSVLYKVARFALAMNSSQQEFIMEILEKNFDLGLKNKSYKPTFACELMSRVRQLQKCEVPVKFSKEVFELPRPVPSFRMTSQRMDIVSPDLSSRSNVKESDIAPSNSPDSQAETKLSPNDVTTTELPVHLHETEPKPHTETKPEIKSEKNVHPYHFCKEIGLKLHVSCSQQKHKLDISKLTKGAMMEVTNFAEKLCGTFEQICLDVLRHNFELDLQSVDSELARNILAHIPAANEERNLVTRVTHGKSKHPKRDYPILPTLNCQNNPNTEACRADSTEENVHKDVSSTTDTEQQDDLNSALWKLRRIQIQHILSVPHGEHCPLYSYSRCKKLGIDFNVGSGIKLNLDPKLLTNGIMVEVNTFAEAMLSSTKDFITAILEYNFDLNLNSEASRNAFGKKLMRNSGAMKTKKLAASQKKILFQLPDSKSVDEYTPYCPKCYQDRIKRHQDKSQSGRVPEQPQTGSDVCADAKAESTQNDRTSISAATRKTIMSCYPSCRKMGLRLRVSKAHRKRKLETRALTWGVMCEVYSFARKLSGTKHKLVNDILEHNFNLDKQTLDLNPSMLFCRVQPREGEHAWFNDVFVIQAPRKCPVIGVKREGQSTTQTNEWKETIRKRQLDMQAKKKRAMVSSDYANDSVGRIGFDEMGLSLDETVGVDYCYMCPIEADTLTDSENSGNEDDIENPTSSCISAPFHTTTDSSFSSAIVDTDMDLPSPSQPDESGLLEYEEEEEIPTDVPNEFDMKEEEKEMESNMWKLRTHRVKQILLVLDKEYCPFFRPKKVNLEFNIGFRPKKNLSADCLTNSVLYKVARFALAMSSSQQEFIMEILEKNFALDLESNSHRYTIACELMNKIRQLQEYEDPVKFSKEVFKLPDSMFSIGTRYQSMDSSISRLDESDVEPSHPPDSDGETRPDPHVSTIPGLPAGPPKTISEESVNLYPFSKEIGLKLHVSCSQQKNKLDVNKLTKGAMMEVTNFAEKLCGTFEQICLDVLRHNFELDLQSVDSELARHILAQIPVANDHRNVATWVAQAKQKNTRRDYPIVMKLNCQYKPDAEICSAASTRTVKHQNVSTSTDKQQNDLNSVLWRLRINQIQRILSVPHGEHCPLYSYSRCKKLDMDFNVGFGVKQNLDPKLLTNGVMVEVNTFAEAMLSSTKDFIMEVLEYNFDLNLNSELSHIAFAEQLMQTITTLKSKKFSLPQKKKLFKLPLSVFFEEYTPDCPKCHQDKNGKLVQDESHSGNVLCHPLAVTSVISTNASSTVKKPPDDQTSFSASVETILNTYPLCKKIGLSLCVDKAHPKLKLDTCVLTWEVMCEVYSFARKLCGTKHKLVNDVLEHNFSLDKQSLDMNPSVQFYRVNPHDGEPAWFSEVFIIQPPRTFQVIESAEEELPTVQRNEWKETVRKRQLEMQAKKEKAMLLSNTLSAVTLTKNKQKNLYPICKKIGLDLDVSSKSADKKKLNLKLLTSSVLLEIQKFAATKRNQYFPAILFDILDYNFEISSQHHRRWEFSIAAATKFHSMIRQYRNTGIEKIFKLPFLSGPKLPQSLTQNLQNNKSAHRVDGNQCVQPATYHAIQMQPVTIMQMNVNPMNIPTITSIFTPMITSVINPMVTPVINPTITPIFTPPVTVTNTPTIAPMSTSTLTPMNTPTITSTSTTTTVGCDGFLPGNLQIKEEEDDPRYGNMPSLDVETNYHQGNDDVRTDLNTEAAKNLVPGHPAGSLGHTACPTSESNNGSKSSQPSDGCVQTASLSSETVIKTESDTEGYMDYYMVTVGQDTEIKEEQEHVPAGSAESEVDVKQECEC
ncbi:uncharacterized protein LOC102193031 [Pundamilia nyererei]|uniref:Uncharacterized protein LOC102193031 n=1 Tax=Pundamilia nyererei TaxID=303518 RepID=A0A9Y3RSU5_9CICH|nr:PREDICTED: uncharacterized protein LOC102193031 [Pundamilia nyererei]XP_005745655.1 PREDICTED: uncharacterized protein LOC102193031 [Pundamilia nyererei]